MTELEKEWQSIDRAIGYIQGFMPSVWAMCDLQPMDSEAVSAEAVGEYEQVVSSLTCSVGRVRELMEVAS